MNILEIRLFKLLLVLLLLFLKLAYIDIGDKNVKIQTIKKTSSKDKKKFHKIRTDNYFFCALF